jgi:predicted GNAT superfamily acetyltransferase
MIELRALTESRQFQEAVDLQKTVWGFNDMELLPVRLFVVATKVGGQAADRTCTAICWACWRNIATRAWAAC